MGAPGNRGAFDPKVAAQAAQRWKARQRPRQAKMAAVEKGDYTKAESKERLAKHANRLLAAVANARNPAGEAGREAFGEKMALDELAPQGAVTAANVSNEMLERIIGKSRDFLAIQFFDKGTTASRAVCKIATTLDDVESFGTGFLVTPSLLITNHHVLTSADDAVRSTAQFNYQISGSNAVLPIESFRLDPARFFLTDQALDFSLVAVAPRSANGTPITSFGFCPLIGAEGKIIIGQPVNVVQHPKGELKQVVIRENKLLDLPEKQANSNIDQFAYYEADTEPGSSGSPVFNDQWEVVALHHSGIPRTNAQSKTLGLDGKVWPPNGDTDQIDWVANEGIRASRLVNFITAATVNPGEDLRKEFVTISQGEVQPVKTENIAVPSVQPAAAQAPELSTAVQSGVVTVTVPLTVTIGFGAGGAVVNGAVAASLAADASGAADGAAFESGKPDPHYANRPGFDPAFLGFTAPLPKLMPAVKNLAAKVGSGNELKYYHYSVVMNAARKLAFVSAVNLDVGAKFQVKREGKDHWYADERIPLEQQAGPELYKNNPLDFGHLTRRQDAAWGTTENAATLANDDTFHLTNCSPQHEVFNQSSKASHNGVLLWGNLEMYVTAQAKKGSKKLSIFNGPVFRTNDTEYRGVQLPKEFWKLIVYVRDNGKPGAVAFVLSQDSLIKNLAAEDFVVGPYKPYQVKVTDLQARTNLDFGAFAQYDAMKSAGEESLMEAGTIKVVAIDTLGDIVI
jgi:endonuclease G, mitochondrial